MQKKHKGFGYHLTMDIIREYQAMPIEKRLAWLYQANLLRKFYPKKTIKLQNLFREGKI